jgi:putative adhesin
MRRGFVALFVAALLGVSAPTAHAITVPPTQEARTTSQINGVVRKLLVDVRGGSVVVSNGRRTTVTRTEHWVYQRPSVRMTFSHGTLSITSRCSNAPLNYCSTDVTATIASTATVLAYSEDGFVRVSGIHSPSVHGMTDNGNVSLADVSADDVKATTNNGDVRVNLTSAPAKTHLRTSNGDINAIVPRGSYALDIRVGSGRVRTQGITNRRSSVHKLSAYANNGNISISGR